MKNFLTVLICLAGLSALGQSIQRNSATTNSDASTHVASATTAGTVTNFPVNKTLWVDPANGSDVTGQRGNMAKPFKTIGWWQSFTDNSSTPFAYYPTGALSVAVGGDLIRVAPGTNWIVAVQLWHPGVTHNGVSLIGAGEGITFLVETNCNNGSAPGQLVTLGPLIQPGNNSQVGGFTYISADGSGSLGPCGYGLNGFGYVTYTNIYPGFTNATMFNISGTPNNQAFDGLYFTSRTNCVLTCRNLHIYDNYDGYAVFPEVINTNYYVELFDCIFDGALSGGVLSTVENVIFSFSTGWTGTNIFHGCVFRTYEQGTPANPPYGVNIVGTTINTLIFLDNCSFETHYTNALGAGIYNDYNPSRTKVIGGNPTVSGLAAPYGYWYDPVQNKFVTSGSLSATNFTGNGSGLTNLNINNTFQTNVTLNNPTLTGTTTSSVVQATSVTANSLTINGSPVLTNAAAFLASGSGGNLDAGNQTNYPLKNTSVVTSTATTTNTGAIWVLLNTNYTAGQQIWVIGITNHP